MMFSMLPIWIKTDPNKANAGNALINEFITIPNNPIDNLDTYVDRAKVVLSSNYESKEFDYDNSELIKNKWQAIRIAYNFLVMETPKEIDGSRTEATKYKNFKTQYEQSFISTHTSVNENDVANECTMCSNYFLSLRHTYGTIIISHKNHNLNELQSGGDSKIIVINSPFSNLTTIPNLNDHNSFEYILTKEHISLFEFILFLSFTITTWEQWINFRKSPIDASTIKEKLTKFAETHEFPNDLPTFFTNSPYKEYINNQFPELQDAIFQNIDHYNIDNPSHNKVLDAIRSLYTLHQEDYNDYKQKNGLSAIMLMDGEKYYGHIYVWIKKHITLMQGIRSSVRNLIHTEQKHVSFKLINGVNNFAKTNDCQYIAIGAKPLNLMKIIAPLCGFEQIHEYRRLESVMTNIITRTTRSNANYLITFIQHYKQIQNVKNNIATHDVNDMEKLRKMYKTIQTFENNEDIFYYTYVMPVDGIKCTSNKK